QGHGRPVRPRRILLALALPGILAAQARPTIRGEVVLSDSTTHARGVVIVATDSAGEESVRALTGLHGEVLLELPAAGRRGLNALRVGYKPTLVPPVAVADGESRTVRIVLGNEAVALAAVRVRGATSCRIRADSGELVARLWEQARAALAASQLDAGGRPLEA